MSFTDSSSDNMRNLHMVVINNVRKVVSRVPVRFDKNRVGERINEPIVFPAEASSSRFVLSCPPIHDIVEERILFRNA